MIQFQSFSVSPAYKTNMKYATVISKKSQILIVSTKCNSATTEQSITEILQTASVISNFFGSHHRIHVHHVKHVATQTKSIKNSVTVPVNISYLWSHGSTKIKPSMGDCKGMIPK